VTRFFVFVEKWLVATESQPATFQHKQALRPLGRKSSSTYQKSTTNTYSPAGQLKLVSGVIPGLLYAMVITWCGCKTS
jgi:hypothetical protein